MGLWRLRKFPVGGWVEHGVPTRIQREDQGQDMEIPLHEWIIAPGKGHCISWLRDGPFPRGFGNPYAVVGILEGRFAGRNWYIGHANHLAVKPGETFHRGARLARADNSLNRGWGWVEIGYAPNGSPGPFTDGPKFRHLFKPAWLWSH